MYPGPHDPSYGFGLVMIMTITAMQISASCSYNLVACPTLNSAVCNCSFQNSSERNQMRMSTSEQHENTHVWFKDIWCSHCWTFGSVSSDSLTSEVFSKKNNQVFELSHHSVLSSHGQWLFCKILTSQLDLSPRKKQNLCSIFFPAGQKVILRRALSCPKSRGLSLSNFKQGSSAGNLFHIYLPVCWKIQCSTMDILPNSLAKLPNTWQFLCITSSLNNSPRIW